MRERLIGVKVHCFSHVFSWTLPIWVRVVSFVCSYAPQKPSALRLFNHANAEHPYWVLFASLLSGWTATPGICMAPREISVQRLPQGHHCTLLGNGAGAATFRSAPDAPPLSYRCIELSFPLRNASFRPGA